MCVVQRLCVYCILYHRRRVDKLTREVHAVEKVDQISDLLFLYDFQFLLREFHFCVQLVESEREREEMCH